MSDNFFLFWSSIFTGIHSITDTSLLAKFIYWTSFVTLIKTFLHFIIFFQTIISLLCLIVVGDHFAEFEQNSQQFSLESILLQPPPLQLTQNSIEPLLLYLLKYLLKHFLKQLYWDDNILWYLLNIFCYIYHKDYIY